MKPKGKRVDATRVETTSAARAPGSVSRLPERDEMFSYPLSVPADTTYDELGIAPDAADGDIGPAKIERTRELQAASSRIDVELKTVYDALPALATALEDIAALEALGGDADPKKLHDLRVQLTELEGRAREKMPDFTAKRARTLDLKRKLNELNALALDQRDKRAAYDREYPPLALLKLAETQSTGLPEDRTALFLIRQEVAQFLTDQGEEVFHPSDWTREDFSMDFEVNPILDER